jgi:hypothetical protein
MMINATRFGAVNYKIEITAVSLFPIQKVRLYLKDKDQYQYQYQYQYQFNANINEYTMTNMVKTENNFIFQIKKDITFQATGMYKAILFLLTLMLASNDGNNTTYLGCQQFNIDEAYSVFSSRTYPEVC